MNFLTSFLLHILYLRRLKNTLVTKFLNFILFNCALFFKDDTNVSEYF